LCAEKTGKVIANRDVRREWEIWHVEKQAKGIWALRSHHSKFLSANSVGKVSATADSVGDSEKWEVHKDGRTWNISFLNCANKKWLTAERSGVVVANRDAKREFEIWQFDIRDE